MWRWGELEGIKKESELLLCYIVWDVADSEDSLLKLDVVDSYGTGSQLVAVEDQVIQVSLH